MSSVRRLVAKLPDFVRSTHAAVAWFGFLVSLATAFHAMSNAAATDDWAKAYVIGANLLMQECKSND